jgi:hypothetical protein
MSVVAIILKKIIDIVVVALYLYLMGYICRFGSCYLHQNRFPGGSLCDIDNIAFAAAVIVVVTSSFLGNSLRCSLRTLSFSIFHVTSLHACIGHKSQDHLF